jgi:hypothetical protein
MGKREPWILVLLLLALVTVFSLADQGVGARAATQAQASTQSSQAGTAGQMTRITPADRKAAAERATAAQKAHPGFNALAALGGTPDYFGGTPQLRQ